MSFRTRALARAFHSSRILRASEGPNIEAQYNEPGGRLFGEPILKPGERRKLYDWEIPYIGTLVIGGVMLAVGLNSRPETSALVWAKEEAIERMAAKENAKE